uniref:ATP-dependent DNA helicase n=1 Tax=Mycena chlorophos TaxID=658473 RepID=A0ABQ0KZW2_MYCCL|nr:predicted protein [Mycena chlorophos]
MEIGRALARFTIPDIISLLDGLAAPSRADKRRRDRLITFVRGLPLVVQQRLRELMHEERAPKRRRLEDGQALPVISALSIITRDSTAVHTGDVQALIDGPFLTVAPTSTIHDCITRFIDATSNAALKKGVCFVCARKLFVRDLVEADPEDLPNRHLLRPTHPHPAHDLVGDMLLHGPALRRPPPHFVCLECRAQLSTARIPPLALANNLWVGQTPLELKILNLAERLLVGLYFPAVYVVKLFPKTRLNLKEETLASGVRGNVSTYRLATNEIADMIAGKCMPRPLGILSAIVGVTFVGFKNLPLRILSDLFTVRRERVYQALLWLKCHNPLYSDIEISAERLNTLPECDVPDEIALNVRYSIDQSIVLREHAGYVPPDADEEPVVGLHDTDDDAPHAEERDNNADTNLPAHMFDHLGPASPQLPNEAPRDYDPAVIPLQAHGSIDVAGDSVSDKQLFSAAIDNLLPPHARRYNVRPSSEFINEYPRTRGEEGTDDVKQRTTGGAANANHLLGCFPVLFPYGMGGVEVDRTVVVTYEQHIRWALQYDDGRFRKDLYFMFLAFGVLQKRSLARSSTLQVRRSAFIQNQLAFQRLNVGDFVIASQEEENHRPISNPVIRSLRNHMTAVRARVDGTDESRIGIRAQVWGMTLRFNPPTIWATLNMADTSDPIAQVLAGEEIDLDHFCQTAGTDSEGRSAIMAKDPFASAEFFHVCVCIVLRELLGITANPHGNIKRRPGILGDVNGYIGTVEAQARGTLHLHILIWLRGAPVARVMKAALETEAFREKVKRFIAANIRAHIHGTTGTGVMKLPVEFNIAYSRPEDPRLPFYEERAAAMERRVARAQQVHDCKPYTCQRVKNGLLICKRRAPWTTADDDWVTQNGEWGPKRLYGFLNAWNPPLLQTLRCNQDMKIITNGAETKDITFYITLYIAKRQVQAANASALLAKGFAYKERRAEKPRTMHDVNKRMLQRCVNMLSRQHEFSGPEAVSYLMNWGDRFISHTFVRIYWDQITSQIRRAFPHVLGTQFATGLLSTMVAAVVDQEKDLHLTLTRNDNGVFVLRDQLKEYTDRGEQLALMNFYDYFCCTYDGPDLPPPPPQQAHAALRSVTEAGDDDAQEEIAGQKRRRGRPRSLRVPYLPGSGRRRCRIVCGPNQEVNLHFIGKWFPRANIPADAEYYSVQMLLLFKPWRQWSDLAGGFTTFGEAFRAFQQVANPDCLRIIENMQYFYECSDRAAARREAHGLDDTRRSSTGDLEGSSDEVMLQVPSMPASIDEEDIAAARSSRYAMRERIYGEGAMAVAFEEGIFAHTYADVELQPIARQASTADMVVYHEWGQRIASYTQSTTFAENNGVDVGAVQVVTDDTALPAAADFAPAVADVTPCDPDTPAECLQLNNEQQRAHDIVIQHLRHTLAGNRRPPLLMIIQGEGGTGKTVVLNAIAASFASMEASHLLAKTATTGVAASLFGGQTLHNWAGMGLGDIPRKGSPPTQAKRERNMSAVLYLIVDEFSMMTKKLLASTSDVITHVKHELKLCEENDTFGGISVILVGDLHQFPPVGSLRQALFHTAPHPDPQWQAGLDLYQRFTTVVTLTQQRRVTDPAWMLFLRRLRVGQCTNDDLAMLRSLRVDGSVGGKTRWTEQPWDSAVLVTPRHSARILWNAESLRKHQAVTGHHVYRCQAEDRISRTGAELSMRERFLVAQRKTKHCGRLAEHVELAVGMRAMVLLNISTAAELANGTRGEIVDIVLDVRERLPLPEDPETGHSLLQYPPAVVLFKPDHSSFPEFEGLGHGIIPIVPSIAKFSIPGPSRNVRIARRQLALTPGYAFTDYKAQGQTIHFVVIDLQPTPTGALTPFSAYVAMSRSHGRDHVRILRGFKAEIFTQHPSPYLQREDELIPRDRVIQFFSFTVMTNPSATVAISTALSPRAEATVDVPISSLNPDILAAGSSKQPLTWTIVNNEHAPPSSLPPAVVISRAANQGRRLLPQNPTPSTFTWEQLSTDFAGLAAGQWLVKEDDAYFLTRFHDNNSVVRFQVMNPGRPLPTRPAEPPLEEIEHWTSAENEPFLVNVFTSAPGVLPGGGSRVVLWDPTYGCVWPHPAYIVGFAHNGLVRVRVAVQGDLIRPHAPDLVSQLSSPPLVSDIRLVPIAGVLPHVSQRLVGTRIGEHLADMDGRVWGKVVEVHDEETWTATTRDELTGLRKRHNRATLQRHFVVGDRVKVVAGPFRGVQGVVSRRVLIGGAALSSVGGFGAVEILLEDPNHTRRSDDRIRISAVYGQIRSVDRPLTDPPWRTAYTGYNKMWLLQAQLVRKRVDVEVDSVLEGSLTAQRAARREMTGYIELDRQLCADDLWTTIRVRMDVGARYRAVAVRLLRPVHVWTEDGGPTCKLQEFPGRVIIIGPDVYAQEENVGQYALVVPPESDPVHVTVKMECLPPAVSQKARYPLASLCRSSNEDRRLTTASRWF